MRSLPESGIAIVAAAGNVSVSNTLAVNNGVCGIVVQPSSSGVNLKVTVSHLQAYDNFFEGVCVFGTTSTGTISVVVSDSIATGSRVGFLADTFPQQARTSLMLLRSVAFNNVTGVAADGAATAALRIGRSAITGNRTSWSATGGAVLVSYGDNKIDGNGDASPAPPVIPRK